VNKVSKADNQSIPETARLFTDFLTKLVTEKYVFLKKHPVELNGVVIFLKLFNVISTQKKGEELVIRTKSQFAENFLKSLMLYLKENFKLIQNWENPHSKDELLQEDFLSWGSLFLRAMEGRRISQSTTKEPLSEVDIILLVIKAKVEGYENPMFLCQFNNKTLHFQLIGGYKKAEEKKAQAIKRLLIKELSLNNLKAEDYKINLIEEGITHYEIARKTSVYTKYNFSFYHLVFKNPILKLRSSDRWVSFDEIGNEKTVDGIALLSPLKPFADSQTKLEFLEKLKKLPLSLGKEQSKGPNTNVKLISPSDKGDNEELKLILKSEESEKLEFKSSMRWDYTTNSPNKGLEKTIVRTIAAFLNSDGGTLVIGVNDEKEILGIKNDLSTFKKKNPDGFFQHVVSLILSFVGAEYTSFVQIVFEDIGKETVAIVKVERSPNPVFIKEGEQRYFYVRSGNTSRELNPEEVYNYIQLHW